MGGYVPDRGWAAGLQLILNPPDIIPKARADHHAARRTDLLKVIVKQNTVAGITAESHQQRIAGVVLQDIISCLAELRFRDICIVAPA